MKFKKSKKLDLTLNIAFNICNLIALLYLIRVSSDVMTPLIFSVFMLVRRYASAIANFLQLGTSQTILRYLPLLGDDMSAKKSLFLSGHLIYAVLILIIATTTFFLSEYLSTILFGNNIEYVGISFWTMALSVVTVGQFLVYSTAIAERHIIISNIINFFSTTGWFLIAVIFCAYFKIELSDIRFLEMILAFQTTLVFITCLLAFFYYQRLFSRRAKEKVDKPFSIAFGYYWSYGLPRTAITFLDGLTLVIGPWLLRYYPIEAGYVVVALSLLRVIQGLLMPISQLAGVFTAESLSSSDHTYLSRLIRFMLGTYSLVTLLAIAFLSIWIDLLVDTWLSKPSLVSGVLKYSNLILLSVLPFVLFNGMKTIIENIWHSPKNLLSLLVSFVAFTGIYFIFRTFFDPSISVKAAYLAMFWILGGACLVWLKQYMHGYLKYYFFVDWLLAIILVYLSSYYLQSYLGNWGFLPSIVVSTIIIFVIALKSKSEFFIEVRRTLLGKI